MQQRWNATYASWLFFISYISGNVMSAFIFSDKQQLYANLFIFLLYVAFVQFGLYVLPSIVLMCSKKISWVTVFKFRKVSWRTLLLSILVYAISQVVMLFIHQGTEMISLLFGRTYQVSVYPIATDMMSLVLLILAIGVIPPVCEELLFRGVLLTGFEAKGIWFAAAMSSALFAIFHNNPYRLIELFFAAWISSLIVLFARSIWPGIAIHVITNVTYVVGSFVQGGDLVKGVTSPGTTPGFWEFAALGVLSIPSLYLCFWLMRKIARIEQNNKVSDGRHQTGSDNKYWMVPIVLSLFIFILYLK